jgi:hypothetical protein
VAASLLLLLLLLLLHTTPVAGPHLQFVQVLGP